MAFAKSTPSAGATRKRGILLTIWLALMLIGYFISAVTYLFMNSVITSAIPGMSSAVIYLLGIVAIVGIAAVYLMFTWKKLGFYIAIGIAAISFIVNAVYLGIVNAILGLIGIAILYILIRGKLVQFD